MGEATDPLTRQWRTGSLPAALIRARAHPEWAGADGGADDKDDAVAELAVELG